MAEEAVLQDADGVRYQDFDAALKDAKPIRFKVAGREHEAPPQLPAQVMLMQLRFSDEENVSLAKLPDLIESLLGAGTLDQMLEDGATWPQLNSLAMWLLQEYGILKPAAEQAEEEVQEANPS